MPEIYHEAAIKHFKGLFNSECSPLSRIFDSMTLFPLCSLIEVVLPCCDVSFFFACHLVYFLHCQDWPTFLKGTIMPACPQVSLFPLSPTAIDDLEEYISRLEFRSFEENLRCLHSRTVVKPQNDATQAHMVSQIGSMERNIATHGHFYTILQKLQIPKQLEYLSNAKNEHVLNTAKWMIDDGRTSIQEFTMGYYYCWLGCLLLPCTKPYQLGLGSSKNSDTCCC